MQPGSTSNSSTLAEHFVLEALSVGCAARARLNAGKGEGVVHGVFDGAINILFRGGLISLVPENGERGPLNLAVRLPVGEARMSSLGVKDGDKAVLSRASFELGNRYLIEFGAAPTYSSGLELPAPLLREDEIAENLRVMTKAAILYGNMAGLGGLLAMTRPGTDGTTPNALNVFASAALPRIIRLEHALRAHEGSTLSGAVRELVGLGPGLTPSSDDMLAAIALLCVLRSKLRGEQRIRVPIARALASLPPGKTTVLSEEFLRQAASGRGNERITRLCIAMLTEGPESVELATKRVLGIGETSGTDAVLGVALGTLLCLGRKPGLTSGESE